MAAQRVFDAAAKIRIYTFKIHTYAPSQTDARSTSKRVTYFYNEHYVRTVYFDLLSRLFGRTREKDKVHCTSYHIKTNNHLSVAFGIANSLEFVLMTCLNWKLFGRFSKRSFSDECSVAFEEGRVRVVLLSSYTWGHKIPNRANIDIDYRRFGRRNCNRDTRTSSPTLANQNHRAKRTEPKPNQTEINTLTENQ